MEGPLPVDSEPSPEISLPIPPPVKVMLDVTSDGFVHVVLAVTANDLEVPAGLTAGLAGIPVPVPYMYTRGATFYPSASSFLQVSNRDEQSFHGQSQS